MKNDIFIGNAIAFGSNFIFYFEFKNLKGEFSFSINRVEEKFEKINYNQPYPGKFDMLYTSNVSVMYKFKKLSAFVNWRYQSGQVFTLPKYLYALQDIEDILDFNEKNNKRMGEYSSVSIGADYEIQKRNIDYKIGLSVTNLFNGFNPVYVKLYKKDEIYGASQFGGIPIFATLKLGVKI